MPDVSNAESGWGEGAGEGGSLLGLGSPSFHQLLL